jgi:hypothetical protein
VDPGETARNPAQDRPLSKGDQRLLEEAGCSIHSIKRDFLGGNFGHYDLYKDRAGNLYLKPKGGSGPGEPVGINLNDLSCGE